jgi:hypothetical protein
MNHEQKKPRTVGTVDTDWLEDTSQNPQLRSLNGERTLKQIPTSEAPNFPVFS